MKFIRFTTTVHNEEYWIEKATKIPFARKIDDFWSQSFRYINCLCETDKWDALFNDHEAALEMPATAEEKIKFIELDSVYHMFSDGASRNNGKKRKGEPQDGTYAYVVCKESEHGEVKTVLESSKFLPGATNNVAELTGMLRGLEQIFKLENDKRKTIIVCSDSQYVVKGASNWIWRWLGNGFTNNEGEPVANVGLWKEFVRIMAGNSHQNVVRFLWVKGHNDSCNSIQSVLNKRVDFLATKLMKKHSERL